MHQEDTANEPYSLFSDHFKVQETTWMSLNQRLNHNYSRFCSVQRAAIMLLASATCWALRRCNYSAAARTRSRSAASSLRAACSRVFLSLAVTSWRDWYARVYQWFGHWTNMFTSVWSVIEQGNELSCEEKIILMVVSCVHCSHDQQPISSGPDAFQQLAQLQGT